MKTLITILMLLISISSKAQNKEAIIETYLKNGAWNHHYLTKEWEEWIDKGIQKDAGIAYLWQQKALPYWKQKKYQLAISYYNKAVELDRETWLSRLAFLKCVFAKEYDNALIDLIQYKKEFGSTYEQDHPLEFYMGLCYLQLNQFDNALEVLQEEINKQPNMSGWVHFLDRFYLAISFYELEDYKTAIIEFDKVLNEYPQFSDAQYYKSICLSKLGYKQLAKELLRQGQANFKKGYTINEDSALYEDYPYQITWQWKVAEHIVF